MSMENHIERLINHVEKTIEIKEYAFLSLGKSNIKVKVKLLKSLITLEGILLKKFKSLDRKQERFLHG